MKLSGKHRTTLENVFADPVRSNVAWSDIEAILAPCGADIVEGRGSRVRVALNGVCAVFHRPHPAKETDKGAFHDRAGDRAMTMMRCEGCEAAVKYDDDAGLFQGQVIEPARCDHIPGQIGGGAA